MSAAVLLQERDPAIYAAWFSHFAQVACENGTLMLAAPSPFVRSYVETHLKMRLMTAVTTIDPSVCDVQLTCS